ncbi:MAG: hypothetical protein ABI718_04520 [Acidobacteriota bacterium]
MTKFSMETVIASKREFGEELAARPVLEKLRILDELLRRTRTIQSARRLNERASPNKRK